MNDSSLGLANRPTEAVRRAGPAFVPKLREWEFLIVGHHRSSVQSLGLLTPSYHQAFAS